MFFLEYLSILRRRWVYVALGLFAGLVAGYLTAPGSGAEPASYQATHRLLVNLNSPSGQALNLPQTALIVQNGDVPERVSRQLAVEQLPDYEDVKAVGSEELRALDITAYASTPKAAERAANLFAEELNNELVGDDQAALDQSGAAAEEQVSTLETQLEQLEKQLRGLPPNDPARETLAAQQQSIAAALSQAQTALSQIESSGSAVKPFQSLEAARGRPRIVEGWQIPESRPARAGLLALFGLILGIIGAVAADRGDTRVRNREDAERAFGLPVIAEIPQIPSGTKGRELVVASQPAAPFVEAHRALRTVVLYTAASDEVAPTNGNGSSTATPARSQVVLITSPAAGEGKTTTVAHLAAVLAEFGKSCLVVSADFRRPRVHELFGVPREPGLADILDSGNHTIRLSDLELGTSFEGVSLLPSGAPVKNPAQLLTETRQLIAAARNLFDFILIDTPPLLVANDATELATVADMVLLVARADRTSRDAATRSAETLRRVDAPIVGVVICRAHDAPTAYGYYRYRYYAEADQGRKRGRRKRDKTSPQPPTDETAEPALTKPPA